MAVNALPQGAKPSKADSRWNKAATEGCPTSATDLLHISGQGWLSTLGRLSAPRTAAGSAQKFWG